MTDLLHQKKLYLDYSNHLELCMSATPEQPPTLAAQPVGTGLCTLLNIGLPRLQRLRGHLSQMMPLTTQDSDAYAIMISIKLGNVALPDSEFAAKLFALLDTISELSDVFYISMQMDKLLNLFEEGASEKTILKQLATTAARTAAALDTAIVELPLYQKRIDGIFNYTEFDRMDVSDISPVLSRALAYQKQSSDAVLQFKNAVAYRLFSREGERLIELFPETAMSEIGSSLFYGNLLVKLPFSDLVRLMFQQMLLYDTVVRACGVCGRYFIPTVRSNEKYCDFVSTDADGTTLSCKQRSTKSRLETDTSLKLLKGAYDKNFIKSGRKKDPDYRTKVFRPWYQWAKQQRALYLDGEIDLEMLTERLRRDMDTYLETPISDKSQNHAEVKSTQVEVTPVVMQTAADISDALEPAEEDETVPVVTQTAADISDALESAEEDETVPVVTQEDADISDALEPAEDDAISADVQEDADISDALEPTEDEAVLADVQEDADISDALEPAEDDAISADVQADADISDALEPAEDEAVPVVIQADADISDMLEPAEDEAVPVVIQADADISDALEPAEDEAVPAVIQEDADTSDALEYIEDDQDTDLIEEDPDAVVQSYLEDPPGTSDASEADQGRSRWKFPWFGQ